MTALTTTASDDGHGAPLVRSDQRNTYELLAASAAEHPDRPAIRQGTDVVTYAELAALTARAAGWLKAVGVQAGDRVAMTFPTTAEFAVAHLGAARLGAVTVPFNPLLKEREVAHVLRDSGARVCLAFAPVAPIVAAGAAETDCQVLALAPGELLELVRAAEAHGPVAAVANTDTAVLLYTSGTTGTPKGVDMSHGALRRSATTLRALLGIVPDDVFLGPLPLFHVFGLCTNLHLTLASGASISLLPRFDAAAAVEAVGRDGVTILSGVPTMYSDLLETACHSGADLSGVRLCFVGGAPVAPELLRRFEQRFACPLLEGYGLTETTGVAVLTPIAGKRRSGSVGLAVPGMRVRVVDEDGADAPLGTPGEILLRGDHVMTGYWGRPEDTAEVLQDGWLRTGDVGTRDADGFLSVVDRSKDMILRGGLNVYPREVEDVLHEHPAVLEAAVVGVPDERLGEEVLAAVVLRPDQALREDELRSFAKERLAAYKYPRLVVFVDELPHGPTGKVTKHAMDRGDLLARARQTGLALR